MTHPPRDEASRTRAAARAALQAQRDADARKVHDEILVAEAAQQAKTARLRALRLAKEEADRLTVTPPARQRPRTARKVPTA